MNGFLYNNNIVDNLPAGNKASLIFRYYFWEHFLDSVCYDLCYYPVGGVAMGDWSESAEGGVIGFLWN